MDYTLLCESLDALIAGVPYPLAVLANAAAFLYESLPDLNWAGFYRADTSPDGGTVLSLGPFQGKPACIEIPWGKGVCGTAAALDQTQLVPDVHDFPGHIACDAASASEIVIPLHKKDGSLWGVLDIDSPVKGRFAEEDRQGLEDAARVIEESLFPEG
ncbi:MAG: GAF domain-containing protein [Clostridia bacterium]|nr:GAF domain-containing protein [Clostridia bacterium]